MILMPSPICAKLENKPIKKRKIRNFGNIKEYPETHFTPYKVLHNNHSIIIEY